MKKKNEDGSEKAGLVSWAVVEMSSWVFPAVPYRSASGLLNALHVQNNGGELFACVFWLKHLDPTGLSHEFYTDSDWLYKGWHGLMDVSTDTPFYHFWTVVSSAE